MLLKNDATTKPTSRNAEGQSEVCPYWGLGDWMSFGVEVMGQWRDENGAE
jgi:hypothetical protein